MYGALDISTSALAAYRTRLDVIAGNIAMKDAVRIEDGEAMPYRRRAALLAPGDPVKGDRAPGVHVSSIAEDTAPFRLRWDPGHVHAIKEGEHAGYVRESNVDYHTEMVNAITAARAYEANVTVIEMTKSMATSTLRLLA
ncbi:MAG: flagellar basal body rod protein FlgC [Phycisphaerae bacterium]|jgi:flagellar basal-body rod protein FlgC